MAGCPPGKGAAELGRDDCQALREIGWLEVGDALELTAGARAALVALCQPNAMATLLLGTQGTVATVNTYSARGFTDDALVSYMADPEEGKHFLTVGLSPATLVDTVSAQVLGGPLDQTVPFQEALASAAFVTLLCILDWRRHTLLRGKLSREPDPAPIFTVPAIWEMLVEGRTASDLTWPVTLFTYLFPFLDYELDEAAMEVALGVLQAQGLVTPTEDGRYTIADLLLELADALVPVVSFAAIHVGVEDDSGSVRMNHLAFLRGPAAIVVAQPVVDEGGRRVVAIDSVDGVELAEMLFELGRPERWLGMAPPFAAPAPAERVCPKCGAKAMPEDKFCTTCAAPLMPVPAGEAQVAVPVPAGVPAFCPACGARVKPGDRFCTTCAAPLAQPREQKRPGSAPAPGATPPFCATCGARFRPGQKFCTVCGAPRAGPPA